MFKAIIFSNTGCLKIDTTYLYDNSYCIIFIWVLKSNRITSEKVTWDDKGSNQLSLTYSAHERPRSWERVQGGDLFPTEALTASTLSWHLAVNSLPYLGFSAFLLRLFTDHVAWNLCTIQLIWSFLVGFGLVSLFNGISTFVGYLMPKPFS